MNNELVTMKYFNTAMEKKNMIIMEKNAEIAKYKKLETEVVRMRKEVEKYKQMFLQRKNVNYEDLHLIHSNEFDDEDVKVISRHITEFGKLAYDHGHQLITRQECNRTFAVYLAPFEDATDLSVAVEAIDKMIEQKRAEKEPSENWPTKRMIPEMKLMTETLKKLEKTVVNNEDFYNSLMSKMDADNENKTQSLNEIKQNQDRIQNMLHEYRSNNTPVYSRNYHNNDYSGREYSDEEYSNWHDQEEDDQEEEGDDEYCNWHDQEDDDQEEDDREHEFD